MVAVGYGTSRMVKLFLYVYGRALFRKVVRTVVVSIRVFDAVCSSLIVVVTVVLTDVESDVEADMEVVRVLDHERDNVVDEDVSSVCDAVLLASVVMDGVALRDGVVLSLKDADEVIE